MTKEELEKEAEEKYFNHEMADFQGFYNYHYYSLGYLESAEPREKRIAELKEQIEKMKCCENCRYYSHTYERCYSYDKYQNCKSLSNWRLAE